MRYVIFPFIFEGVKYVNAYPTHGFPDQVVEAWLPLLGPRCFVERPSGSQARRTAYEIWIGSRGHNKSHKAYLQAQREHSPEPSIERTFDAPCPECYANGSCDCA